MVDTFYLFGVDNLLRIAYLITRADEIGGAHIHVRDLACWMRRQGHEVRVFVGGCGAYLELLEAAVLPYRALGRLRRSISIWHDWRAIAELTDALRDYNPDLVSLHSAKAGLLGRIACRKLKLPVIFTAHGWSFAEGVPRLPRYMYLLLERWAAAKADKIITVCEADRQFALLQGVTEADHIVTVNNGMPEIEDTLLADPVHPIPKIVMVARFEKQKDHFTLITALGGLTDIDWRLELVGAGPLQDQVLDLVEQHHIQESVVFLGRREDVAQILAAADVFVLASFWEGFPRSILEAMRAALPVIASSVAGVPEAVVDGDTGYLVVPGDVTQLRDRLRRLLTDKELRKAMGASGCKRFDQYFTFEEMANKTLAIYTGVVPA